MTTKPGPRTFSIDGRFWVTKYRKLDVVHLDPNEEAIVGRILFRPHGTLSKERITMMAQIVHEHVAPMFGFTLDFSVTSRSVWIIARNDELDHQKVVSKDVATILAGRLVDALRVADLVFRYQESSRRGPSGPHDDE